MNDPQQTSRRANAPDLPVLKVADDIIDALAAESTLLLTAPTGSGKTTQAPRILMQSGRIEGQIIVLQPRRIAARMMASRIAAELGQPLGQDVGYITRHDSRIGRDTRIRFITEGLLVRLWQSDPQLRDVGAVILDEFHERHLAADVSLALLRHLQATSRPDLKLLIMSATLDTAGIAKALHCPVVEAHGRMFPVDIRYAPPASNDTPVWDAAARAVADVLSAHDDGDLLVFMPGAYEIARTIDACRNIAGAGRLSLLPLHSGLPIAQQDAAVAPAQRGVRKVIVATNVAETSITIAGVHHVIDAGLARVASHDMRRGLNALELQRISKSSADQRAGRAGRTAPGTCTRLWSEQQHKRLDDHTAPEIERLDLSDTVLQLRSMKVDENALPWLQPPPKESISHARELLRELGAIDEVGRVTEAVGQPLARLPMHPRIGRMLLEAAHLGLADRAATWAAIITEPDVLFAPRAAGRRADAADVKHHLSRWLKESDPQPPGVTKSASSRDDDTFAPCSDFVAVERAIDAAARANFHPGRCSELSVHANAARQVAQTRDLYRRAARDLPTPKRTASRSPADEVAALTRCVLAAFSDHLAKRHKSQKLACTMTHNRRGEIDAASLARDAGLVVAVDICQISHSATDPSAGVTRLSLASAVDSDWLGEMFPDRVHDDVHATWDDEHQAVLRVTERRFDDLVIEQATRGAPDPQQAATMLAERILSGQLRLSRWNDDLDQWIERARCVAEWFSQRSMITYDEDDLRILLEELCDGATRFNQVKDKPVDQKLRHAMDWDDQQFVEQMAPTRIELGGKKRDIRLTYRRGGQPRGQARISDLYDYPGHPTVAGGRQKVLLEILAPNFRPVQITDDLPGFWQRTYPQVKKDLARRYPKHEWR